MTEVLVCGSRLIFSISCTVLFVESFTVLGVDGQGIGCLDLVGARQSTLNTCFADLNVVVWCLGRGASGLFYGNTIDMSPFWWWWS